jgi:hypothetical protein
VVATFGAEFGPVVGPEVATFGTKFGPVATFGAEFGATIDVILEKFDNVWFIRFTYHEFANI